jgi:hypothetical protein
MKSIKSTVYKFKKLFMQICLVVGVLTVIKHSYLLAQKRFNTSENHILCSIQVNPSYSDKLKCTTVSLLSVSNNIQKQINQQLF